MSKDRPKHLPNKPLVEAIVEIKWGKEGQPDPGYPVIVGRLYERVAADYPVIEDLPVTQVPAELTVHMVRHRFRRVKDGWPLVQIGPGVLTVNETEGYQWDDFCGRVRAVLPKLYEAHPSPEALNISSLLLRYINAIEFDYLSENLLAFLSAKMQTSISLQPSLFKGTGVESRPDLVGAQLIFAAKDPPGALKLQIGSGNRKGQNALIWEIHFRSAGSDIPKMPDRFPAWLEAAHAVVERWFFEMVRGELLDSFMKA